MKKNRNAKATAPSKESKKKEVPNKNLKTIIIGIVLVLTFAAYIPVLSAGFINWDDNQYVYENTLIRGFSQLRTLVSTPLQGNYHPITMLSLAFNYSISGYHEWSYHLLNLLLHLANTYLVFKLAFRLSKQNLIIAITTALLFGVHPMHVESVAWVAERKDMLYSFFFLIGLISYINFIEKKETKYYILSIVWLTLSLLSKPAAVVFPLCLFAIDLLFERKFEFKTIAEKTPHFLLALIVGILTATAQKNVGATESITAIGIGTRLLFGCYSFMMYFLKMIAPINLAPFYPFPSVKEALPWLYYLAPVFFVSIAALCLLTFKKNKIITFGILFYFINILLIMQFFIVGRAIVADRYSYMPYVGMFLIFGWLLSALKAKYNLNPYSILVPLGLLFTGMSYAQASHWKSGATLWEHAIEVAPCSRALQNRATLYRKEGNTDLALELYTRALTYHDDVIEDAILTNRGNIYFDKKQYDLARDDYSNSIKLNANDYLSFENRASAYLMKQKLDSAIMDLNTSLTLKSDNASGYYKRGVALMNSSQHEAAIPDFKRYLVYKPTDSEVMNSVGICFRVLKNYNEALIYFNAAINISNKAAFYLNRSYCYQSLGKIEEARNDALTANKGGMAISKEYAAQLGLK